MRQRKYDYPDFVVPLARAVACGQVHRGVAIRGSGAERHLRRLAKVSELERNASEEVA
jgi:ribose 5-phosphate isomerase RpiB